MGGGGGGGGEGRVSVQLALSDFAIHTVFPMHVHKIAPKMGSICIVALEQQHCSGNSPVDNRATQLARLHERDRNQRVWRPRNDD